MSTSAASPIDSVVIAAPMAGGPSTPALVSAAARAGFVGFLAAGYQTAPQLAAQIAATRETTAEFGVNLFAPSPVPVDAAAYARYRDALRPLAERFGVDLPGMPRDDDDDWHAKLDLLEHDPVPLVSVTFGIPPARVIHRLARHGTVVVQTVTNAAEARAAEEAGAHAVIAQALAAGGHSATLDATTLPADIPLPALVASVGAAVRIPVIATGGVSTPEHVSAALGAGASAVMVGTALLRAPESGTSTAHRAALTRRPAAPTTMTRAFTGRPARGIRNAFIDEFEGAAPLGYPALHHLTSPIRRAAAAANDLETAHLWAGVGYAAAAEEAAGDILTRLAAG